jgi:formylglycine-generating enzyme required for sulfatase activity
MSAIRRVFISHTAEFTKFPEKKSFIDAAVAAINRAGMVPSDMGYFTARDEKPAKLCEDRVRECDIYVGIIGFRYGSPVRDRPELSYTELEFVSASQSRPKTRLVFFLDPSALVPIGLFSDTKYGDRQETFRKRLSDAGITCKPFSDVHELENLIYQALIEVTGSGTDSAQESVPWPENRSPYPGLLWFDEEYAPLFFGRDREVAEVITKMSEPEGRFIVISGASGSGKSSLVGAGVWRALKAGRMSGSQNWFWRRVQPDDGRTPFDALAWGLKQTFQKISGRPDTLAAELATSQNKLSEILSQHISSGQEMILFLDQLEGLFTHGFPRQEITDFLELLLNVASAAENRLRVIATIRSEFVTHLEASDSLRALLNAGYGYRLGRVSPRTLQDMIEKPAAVTGYEFDQGLVSEILEDSQQQPGRLPLVAYALKRLFETRTGRRFTRDSYLSMGKVAGAIGNEADRVIERFGPSKIYKAFDRLFSELVHIQDDRSPTRRRVPLSNFTSNPDVSELIEALAAPACRILITDVEQNSAYLEVAHEELFTAWHRLKEWIDKGADLLRLIGHASEEARGWYAHHMKARDLWSSDRLADVSAALERFGKKATEVSTELNRFLHPQITLIEQLDSIEINHTERALIGNKLVEFGDPRSGVGLTGEGILDISWIDIPPGTVELERAAVKDVSQFLTEENYEDERATHGREALQLLRRETFIDPMMPVLNDESTGVFDVGPFRISRYPVTNIQFEAFVKAEDGYQNEQWWQDLDRSQERNRSTWTEDTCPRTDVSWYEAVAFCRWASMRLHSTIRLPTEWEWQQAATGGDVNHVYPWGQAWDPARCNSKESRLNRTTPVGVYPNGRTSQQVFDMAGNVSEWCLNRYDNPNDPSATIVGNLGERVIRGGSWYDISDFLRSSNRRYYLAHTGYDDVGFRLVQEIK